MLLGILASTKVHGQKPDGLQSMQIQSPDMTEGLVHESIKAEGDWQTKYWMYSNYSQTMLQQSPYWPRGQNARTHNCVFQKVLSTLLLFFYGTQWSCLTLVTPLTVAFRPPLSISFLEQEYWWIAFPSQEIFLTRDWTWAPVAPACRDSFTEPGKPKVV